MSSVSHLHAHTIFTAPRDMPHYSLTKDQPVVLQIFAIAPSGLNYVNPPDDPRRK